jgi:hypothetical protein
MTSTDKEKLDNIENNANNYDLPVADDVTLGGVMIGDGINMSYGEISVDWSELPVADDVTLGGVMIGDGINMLYGAISVDWSSMPVADDVTLGGVMIGDGINMSYGEISVDWTELPVADDVTLGGVMIGDGINISYGAISVDWSSLVLDDTMHGVRGGGNLHSLVTDSVNGFMSTTDKTKLDGVEDGANNYVLPTADDTTLGGVMIGDGINMLYGEISVNWSEMPSATDSEIGGVTIGDGINMSYGEISVDWNEMPAATDSEIGGVIVGDGIDYEYGVISVDLDASNINYSPFEDDTWSTVPDVVSSALDELASRIKTLESAGSTTWYEVFDTTYWSSTLNTFSSGEWASAGANHEIILQTNGGWHSGFRPTKMRVTFHGDYGFPVVDVRVQSLAQDGTDAEDNNILRADNVYNLEQVTVNLSDDFWYLIIKSDYDFYVTNIEFDVEALIS